MGIRRAVVLVALGLLAGRGDAQPTPSPGVVVLADGPAAVRGRALLAAARAACGGAAWDRVEGWHERGRMTVGGRAAGSYEAWAAITRLAMAVATTSDGTPPARAGTDGRVSWRVLTGGGVDAGPPAGPDRLHRRDAYLSNFAWFFPDRYPATVTARDARTIAGTVYDVVGVTPAGDEGFDLWLDRATHRIARIMVGSQLAELSDYRFVAGVCAPTVAIQSDGDPAHTTRFDLDSVDTGPVPPAVFAPPG